MNNHLKYSRYSDSVNNLKKKSKGMQIHTHNALQFSDIMNNVQIVYCDTATQQYSYSVLIALSYRGRGSGWIIQYDDSNTN